MSTSELALREERLPALPAEMTIDDLLAQSKKIHQAMELAMTEGVHYGRVPGVDKPFLFQAGAEKLMLLFRLDPQFHSVEQWDGAHLTVKSICTLYHIPTGNRLGSGEGSCSTKESRYAYRTGKRVCPTCGADAIIKGKAEYGGGWLCFGKRGGCGAKWPTGAAEIEQQKIGRVPNEDLPDVYNTVLKMANKRAKVAAVINVTGCSDIVTQDEELFEASAPTPGPETPFDEPERMEPTQGELAPAEATVEVDEAAERNLLHGRIKGLADTLKLDSKARVALWDAHVGGDPRVAPIEKLNDLLAVLRARRKA